MWLHVHERVKKTVFNYLDVLILKRENVNVVEVTNSSKIGSFALYYMWKNYFSICKLYIYENHGNYENPVKIRKSV